MWMNMQIAFDLSQAADKKRDEIERVEALEVA